MGGVYWLRGEEMAARMHYGKKAGWYKQFYTLGNVLFVNLGSCIHKDATLTHTTYLKIVKDHVHLFIAMVFPDGSGLFQQDDASATH